MTGLKVDTRPAGAYAGSMTPTIEPTLASIDQRLSHVETQVSEIHKALVGSTDGSVKGLQSRVERLEGWLKWIGTIATAAILGAIGNFLRGNH